MTSASDLSTGTKRIGSSSMKTEKNIKAMTADLYIRDSDFLTEETFHEVLCFERKRSERSRKNILLMLLDVGTVNHQRARCAILRNAANALNDLRQDAHVKGWYKNESILGAVFTEYGEKLEDRVRTTLFTNLSQLPWAQDARSLKLIFRSFPDAGPGDNPEGFKENALFYPEALNVEKRRQIAFFLKRAMDIAGGAAGIMLFSPLFIVLPLLIKASSKGPVLFRQERIGRYGERFVFLKFRTMYENNNPQIHQDYIKKLILEQKSYEGNGSNGVFKIKDDPRVTPIGRFLRKTSFDELPQFLNVLKGEMSLVGPRPPIPYEFDNYDLWHRRRVMEVKPGITGLWQVEGRSSTTFDEMVRLDLKYSKEWSIWLDIKIMLKTPWVVIAGKGAY